MGARGPKPTPTHLKLLRGNPGKRALPRNEPAPTVGLPPPPAGLPQQYADAWPGLAEHLVACGIATMVDGPAFELLVRAYVDHQHAAAQVAATKGPLWITKGEDGLPEVQVNPWWNVLNKEWKKLTTMLAEFGIGPASRTRVELAPWSDKPSVPTRARA